MLAVIWENKEWLFSGVGLVLIGGVIGLLRLVRERSILPFAGFKQGKHPTLNKGFDVADAFTGTWKGTVVEVDCPAEDRFHAEVTWEFKRKGEKITCHSCARYTTKDGQQKDCFELIGRVVFNRFLVLDYYYDQSNSLNFGSEILEIDGDGKAFTGRYVGYSTDRKHVATGILKGQRVPSFRA